MSDVGEGCLVFGSLNVDWVELELSLWQLMSVGVAGDGRLDTTVARVGPVMALINRNC